MNTRATTEFKFLLKYLLIGLACLGFAVFSLYDGLVRYPARIPRAAAWEKLNAELPDGPVDEKTWKSVSEANGLPEGEIASDASRTKRGMWKQIAKKNNWNTRTPTHDESVESIEHLVNTQFLFLAVGLIIGVPCMIWFFRTRNTWIESTNDGLRASWGQEFKCSQISEFDKKKWEKKGIGVLHYSDGSGAAMTFILDDLKYQRKPMDEIVAWVESKLTPEQIINGEPESSLIVSQDNVQKESDSQTVSDARDSTTNIDD